MIVSCESSWHLPGFLPPPQRVKCGTSGFAYLRKMNDEDDDDACVVVVVICCWSVCVCVCV